MTDNDKIIYLLMFCTKLQLKISKAIVSVFNYDRNIKKIHCIHHYIQKLGPFKLFTYKHNTMQFPSISFVFATFAFCGKTFACKLNQFLCSAVNPPNSLFLRQLMDKHQTVVVVFCGHWIALPDADHTIKDICSMAAYRGKIAS